MPKVTVHNDFYPDDEVFILPVLGGVTNHQSKDVTDAQVEQFKADGFEWPEKGNLVIKYKEGMEPDPPEDDVPEPRKAAK